MSTTEHRTDGWWIVGLRDIEPCGPYDTKAEAEDTRRRLERFDKFENRPGYVTCETATTNRN